MVWLVLEFWRLIRLFSPFLLEAFHESQVLFAVCVLNDVGRSTWFVLFILVLWSDVIWFGIGCVVGFSLFPCLLFDPLVVVRLVSASCGGFVFVISPLSSIPVFICCFWLVFFYVFLLLPSFFPFVSLRMTFSCFSFSLVTFCFPLSSPSVFFHSFALFLGTFRFLLFAWLFLLFTAVVSIGASRTNPSPFLFSSSSVSSS